MPRFVLTLLLALSFLSAVPTDAASPLPSWPTMTPEEGGVDSSKLADALLTMQSDVIGLHSVLLIRDGKVALDASFYPYAGDTPHEVASVTKSVMTTLIGIAIEQGKLTLDQPMVSFFPDRTIENMTEGKERVTVEHLASTMSGLDCTWQPDEPTLDEMRAADDWIQFALDRPMVAEPGSRWEYCSPDFHLLSAILTSATGMTALDFGWEYLFGPLGMREVIWPADPQGYTHGWGDLYLYPQDAAKLGQLWLDGGTWNGDRIVSQEWVESAVTARSATPDEGQDYGLGWWIEHESEVGGEFKAAGRGGQYVIVYPALRIIVVTTGNGIYGSGDVTDLLGTAVVNPLGPIPANPEALDALNEVVARLAEPPAAEPVTPEPSVAANISGVTYLFDTNPLQLASFRIDFDGTAEATIRLTFENANPVTASVGLDGRYRFTPYDYSFPLGLRGAWTGDDTFTLDYNEIANRDAFLLEVHFTGESVTLQAIERTHQSGVELTGTPVPD